MPIFAFALAVAFWPGVIEPATAPRWILASIAIPMMLMIRPPKKWSVGHSLFALWFGYSLISSAWSPSSIDAFWDMWILGLMFGAFLLGFECRTPERVWKAFALGVSVSSVVCIAQLFGWTGVDVVTGRAGLFMNHDLLAETAIFAMAFGAGMSGWLIAAMIPAVVLPGCRAALVALVTMGLLRTGKVAWLALLAGMVWLAFNGDYVLSSFGIAQRLGMWRDCMANLTLFGHGVGSFNSVYPLINHTFDIMAVRPEHPHNEFVSLFFELGVGAMFPLALLVWLGNWKLMAPIFCVLFFGFALHMPMAVMVAFGLGCLARQRDMVRVSLWSKSDRLSSLDLFGTIRSDGRAANAYSGHTGFPGSSDEKCRTDCKPVQGNTSILQAIDRMGATV